jgi:hypothetical protein
MDSHESDGFVSKNPAQLALDLYNLLFPHPSDVRQKAIRAAMMSLGEAPIEQPRVAGSGSRDSEGGSGEFVDTKLGPKAIRWAQKHGVSRAMLDEVFHLDDDAMDVIASSVPGPSRREMTVQCYLLCGVRGLLRNDVPSLDEGDAISLCKRLTAYDKNNHTTNRNAMANKMTGTRPSFTLTGPGEAAGAELIKQMTTSAKD